MTAWAGPLWIPRRGLPWSPEVAGGGTTRYIRYIRDLTAGGAVDHHSVLSALPTRATVLPVTKLSASLVRVRGRSARLGLGVGWEDGTETVP